MTAVNEIFIKAEMDGEQNSARDMLRRVETVKLRTNFYRERVRNISTSCILEYCRSYCKRNLLFALTYINLYAP